MAVLCGHGKGMAWCGSARGDGSRRRQQRTGPRGRDSDTAADGLGDGPAVGWIFLTAFKPSLLNSTA